MSEEFYLIILDYNLPDILKNNYDDIIFTGRIKENLKKNKIPILYNIDDCKYISKKFIGHIMKNGTSDKKTVPIFGALAFKYKSIENINSEKLSIENKDYTNVNDSNAEIVKYDIDNKQRGLIKINTLKDKCKLISIEYVYKMNINFNIGMLFLNLKNTFNVENIKLLKKIYDHQESEPHLFETNMYQNNEDDTIVDKNCCSIGNLDGEHVLADYYKKKAQKEKRKYKHLKSKINQKLMI
jgi:hypothetical protein